DSKWRIINELSRYNLSPVELAKKLRTSIANISTQLRLLEALNIVKKNKSNNTGKGKPRTIYSLTKQFSYITLIKKNFCGKKFMRLNELDNMIFSVYFINDSKVQYYLLKFYFLYEKEIRSCTAFGFIGYLEKDIEILAIHPDKQEIIQRFENIQFTNNEITRKIIVNVYTGEELEKGVNEKDQNFVSLVDKCYIIYDPVNLIYNLKTKKIEKNNNE
ncbi:winged helix-turn-helix transcriptional regulator, partial [Candidatus Woesearchaeota archaeon]|nr:winged helix-turn-helix transcriptional regulator [Candidatus Woesearchaeota archaeon]